MTAAPVNVSGARCVVTGGAGFIGSHIVDALLDAGAHVAVLDNFSTGKRENIEHVARDIELIEGSIVDAALCERALRGARFVFHQAALSSVPRSVADPVASHEANATGTLNILDAARKAGVERVVYAASSSAYGNTKVLPKHEEMQPLPMSPYAVTKLTGEEYCRAFHASFGLPTVALRYFNVFGPRQDPMSEYAAVVPKFIVSALRNESPTIYGDGGQTRDFTFIENVVRANMLALSAPDEALGQPINVGCGERISVRELWDRIRSIVGSSADARYEPARAGDVRDSLASLQRARALLRYEPLVTVAEGLQRTVESLR